MMDLALASSFSLELMISMVHNWGKRMWNWKSKIKNFCNMCTLRWNHAYAFILFHLFKNTKPVRWVVLLSWRQILKIHAYVTFMHVGWNILLLYVWAKYGPSFYWLLEGMILERGEQTHHWPSTLLMIANSPTVFFFFGIN